MARNPFRNRPTEGSVGQFSLTPVGDAGWRLHLTPDPDMVQAAQRDDSTYVPPTAALLLAEWLPDDDALDTFPVNTTSLRRGLFKPKYRNIKAIRFEGFGFSPARSTEEVSGILEGLPTGFVRMPSAGLGIDFELRSISDALDELNIDRIILLNGSREKAPRLDGRDYFVARSIFDKVRRAVRTVHTKALDQASEEKDRVAANTLLHSVDPIKHPLLPPTYKPGGVTALIAERDPADFALGDRRSLVRAARSAVRSTAPEEPAELLALNREIEIVTLDVLIARIEALLAKGVGETVWQRFFEVNPFILRLAFGYPVIRMHGQTSVGGGRFDGSGTKITDFMLQAAATGNLALIEIKTGETALLERSEYRSGVYPPGRELAGAVNQVLDQIYQLQMTLPLLKQTSGIYDVEAYAVQGLVIAGKTPTEKDRKKSLELYRHSLKAVTVVTFDELVDKLKALRDFLAGPLAREGGEGSPPEEDGDADGPAEPQSPH